MSRMLAMAMFVFILIFVFQIGQTESELKENLNPAQVFSKCLILRFKKCYAIFNEDTVTYSVANETCHRHGGKLAAIPDEHTQKFIQSHFVRKDNINRCLGYVAYNRYCRIWFDLFTRWKHSTEFFTSGGILSNYSNWNYGQPDSVSQIPAHSPESFCGAFDGTDGFWYDDSCQQDQNYFLCEREGTSCNVKLIQIPNASFDFCNEDKLLPVNTIIRIQCDDGYTMRGNKNVVCRRNGTWTKFPSCLEVCPPPTLPSHSQLFEPHREPYYKFGDSNVIMCDPGYVLESDPTRSHFVFTCTVKSDWKNIPTCVPINKFQVIRKAVKYDKKVKLECQLQNKSINSEHWLWQKNSQAVTGLDGYTIDNNGTLRISKFQRFHEGVYTCFAMSPRITVGLVSYDLKLQTHCSNVLSSSAKTDVEEGNPLVLHCPHAEIEESATSVTWTKDGNPLIQSDRVYVIPDGSLINTNVTYSDRGYYTCDVSWDSGRCTSRLFTDLVVEPLAQSICGNSSLMNSWTVSLYLENEEVPFCYGTLIHKEWIITSAYCMSTFSRKKVFKVFVRFDKELDSEDIPDATSSKIRYLESFKIHPLYSPRLFANDIALVKLKKPVTFTDDIQPICLTDKDLSKTKPCIANDTVQGLVSGWGYLNGNDPANMKFNTDNMSVVTPEHCLGTATPAVKYSDSIFCATPSVVTNLINSSVVTNAGGFGSPFVVLDENRVYLLGIFILGERHTHLGNNDHFTKVSNYYSWIKSTIA